MDPLEFHRGKVCPLNRANVDTDQIIPKQFLKRIERTGFGQFLFFHWRFNDDGTERSDFVLNDPNYQDATILVAGDNFGCGSSREHAPWALADYGFKVIIAPDFADIFYNNALKNGILVIKMDEQQVKSWMHKAEDGLTLDVDLKQQIIQASDGTTTSFEITPYQREKLINGWDDIALTLLKEEKIAAYESAK
ncbi:MULTISPECIES: 3-isopropylmalate dehydratase small subunit [unclassified Oceanobacillus]|uniref:3-isopropylmalate dehydratase small subunit n=1 Tax=unclassified Oceanobacillus TaxID=2630292 RepID=UPI001BE99EAD|nr:MULTISPECIES: 3-isopropylmalate dehydratase small subunit [unclassified Oceanobacillus]MBT2600235.1 3-isopropylmalate dehydratase small subunit [Oceanobacillus sp. ISL-74]MBT2650393.1 3-isopropylmalate dehydratase small subunit [Oceanobacillus sp. ISL-73]